MIEITLLLLVFFLIAQILMVKLKMLNFLIYLIKQLVYQSGNPNLLWFTCDFRFTLIESCFMISNYCRMLKVSNQRIGIHLQSQQSF